MMKVVRNFALLGLVAAGALLANPSPAHAAFTLTLQETGFGPITITDNGAGDVSGASGVITFSGAFGDFFVQVSTGSSNSAGGTEPAQLTINSLSITGASSSALTITLTDTGFTAPTTSQVELRSQLSTTQLPLGTTVTFTSSLNGSAGTPLTLTTVGGTTGLDIKALGGTPFTLSNVTTFNLTAAGTVQATGITTATSPEPATVAMVATALPILGLGYWRRRRAQS